MRCFIGGKKFYPKFWRKTIACMLFLLVVLNMQTISSSDEKEVNINYLHVYTSIENSYAITEIKEEIENPNKEPANTTFSFQIPENAFISNFSLTIDGKTYYAKVMEKKEAEEKYKKAVEKGKDAGLLFSRGRTKFSYSISLSPSQKVIVGLKYEEFIKKVLGKYEYNLSLSGSKKVGELNVSVHISYSANIKNISASYEETSIIQKSEKEVYAYYTAKDILPKDFILSYEVSNPPTNGRMLGYTNGRESFFMHVFSPQLSEIGKKQLEKDIIFVLDKSGSMSGEKISQLKDAFEVIVRQLREGDTFNIIKFDDSVEKLSEKMIAVTNENKDSAIRYINNIKAAGSTNINSALTIALRTIRTQELRAPIVVFLTDGLPTAGITNTTEIRKNIMQENTMSASIYSLGFGYDVDFEFLKALSLENYGFAIRIYPDADASIQIANFYETISTPLLRNLRFNYTNGYDFYPEHASYLFDGSEIVIVGKCNGNTIASNVIATTSTGEYSFKETFLFELLEKNSFIERFWAYVKINHLLDIIAIQGEDENNKNAIISIAMNYSFVTPYTSLFVEIDENKQPAIEYVPSKETLPTPPTKITKPYKKAAQACTIALIGIVILALPIFVVGKKGNYS